MESTAGVTRTAACAQAASEAALADSVFAVC